LFENHISKLVNFKKHKFSTDFEINNSLEAKENLLDFLLYIIFKTFPQLLEEVI